MRVRAGSVVVEPWVNQQDCLDCLRERGCIEYVLTEPIVAFSTLYKGGEAIVRNVLLAIGLNSYIVKGANDALECNCVFLVIEKDSWGEARPFVDGE